MEKKIKLADIITVLFDLNKNLDDDIIEFLEDNLDKHISDDVIFDKLIDRCISAQTEWIQDTFNLNVTLIDPGNYDGSTLTPNYAQYKINNNVYMEVCPVHWFVYDYLWDQCEYDILENTEHILVDISDTNNIINLIVDELFSYFDNNTYYNYSGICFTLATKDDIKLLDSNLINKVAEILDDSAGSVINFKDGSETLYLKVIL